jgi:uncharacterized protein (DUF885 family)
MRRFVLGIAGLSIVAASAGASAGDLDARRKAFNALVTEQWEYQMSTSPEYASILGDKRWNDKVSDFSQKAIDADLAKSKDFVVRFEAIDATGFPEQEALTRILMIRNFKEQLDNARFRNWEMPISQINGIHLLVPQLVSLLSFETVKDYDDYIARLKQYPAVFDQTIVQMQKGLAEGLMPPRFLLEKVSTQCEKIAETRPEDSPFAIPLQKMPKTFSEADRERIRTGLLAVIKDSIVPAYVKLGAYVKAEYAPKGRTEPGVWSLPDGAARYAALVKSQTTTDLTPEQIHQIGLQQVAEIEAQMLVIAKKLGYVDLKSFNAAIARDPKLRAKSREEILDLYRQYIAQMKPQLPKLFGRLPKGDCIVMPVEEFREKEASGAQYEQGTPDGKRPGHVMVNTSNPTSRKTISMESTAYHEGLPGHHLQIAIAQELEGLPPVRQQAGYTAFQEGWALYSERLGKEVGFYQDPYNDYGRLQDEMLRAIRLVVDTGFHHKKWTRQQVVDFFHDHSAIVEVDVQSETDRYISDPGQALAYKIGQLKILELRERAKTQLGPRFDIRAFHDTVLDAGALPLEVLTARVDAWIAAESGKGAAAGK